MLLLQPIYYANARRICVDYKTAMTSIVKYDVIIKITKGSIEHSDIINVTRFDPESIQVFEIKKEKTNDINYPKSFFLRDTNLYVRMHSENKRSISDRLNCKIFQLNDNNKNMIISIDEDSSTGLKVN